MTDGKVRWRGRWLMGVAAVVLSGLTACGSTRANQPATAGADPSRSVGAAGIEAKPVDACALLSISGVRGDRGHGRQWPAGRQHRRRRQLLRLGEPGHLPLDHHQDQQPWHQPVGGNLPTESAYGQTEAGSDGIRFASGGVRIPCGPACEIQVVAGSPKPDRPRVRLVGLVRDRA